MSNKMTQVACVRDPALPRPKGELPASLPLSPACFLHHTHRVVVHLLRCLHDHKVPTGLVKILHQGSGATASACVSVRACVRVHEPTRECVHG